MRWIGGIIVADILEFKLGLLSVLLIETEDIVFVESKDECEAELAWASPMLDSTKNF